MLELKTDYGTFTADDEKALLRKARKAKREHEKRMEDESESRRIANQLAEEIAYRHVKRHLAGERLPHPWLMRQGDKHFPIRQDTDSPHTSYLAIDETADLQLIAHTSIAVLISLDGAVQLLWTQSDHSDGNVACIALASWHGQAGYAYLPDGMITPEQFETEPVNCDRTVNLSNGDHVLTADGAICPDCE